MRPERGAVGKSPVPHTFGKSSMSPWGHFKGPHFIHMEVSAETLLMLVWGSVLTSARRRQEEPISQSRLWEFAEVACESAWHQLLPCGTEEYSLVSSRKFAADNLGMMWHGRASARHFDSWSGGPHPHYTVNPSHDKWWTILEDLNFML